MDVVCGRAWSAVVGVATLVVILLPTRSGGTAADYLTPGFRPPSVPLVVVDPYLSIWSNADHLYDDSPRHWSGPAVNLSGMISIDGKLYRFMANNSELPVKVMQQTKLSVYPTQTVYVFQQDGVQLELTFSTNRVPLYSMAYLTYKVSTIDYKSHSVRLYYDNTAEGTVENVYEDVVWNRTSISLPAAENGNFVAMRFGTKEQVPVIYGSKQTESEDVPEDENYLGQTGDMIDWGYWYVTVYNNSDVSTTIANSSLARAAFMSGSKLPPDDEHQPRPCADNWPVLAVVWDLGEVQPSKPVIKYLSIIYDQVYSIRYFGTAMAPLWTVLFDSTEQLILFLTGNYPELKDNCDSLDQELLQLSSEVGSSNYTTIISLAWRQVFGATVAVYNNVTEEPWMFLKEISSGGDVSTVDVLFPASPYFLWTASNILELLLKPVLEYSINDTEKYGLYIPYNLNWAPHHLGKWPICDVLPNLQEQMPLEESGDMLSMIAGIVHDPNNDDISWLKPYWPVLFTWANFTVSNLPNPPNQRCTDDFEGPSPQNVNLAAKGIVALAAFSYLLRKDGQTSAAEYYEGLNKGFIDYWMKNALDGDHYRRQYNLSDTWSLKYNLLYQKILQMDVFPDSVFLTEEKYYQTKMNEYGVPLDDRHDYTKTDWLMWMAAMGSEEQFQAITDAVYKFANETPDRFPFTDWYDTTTGKRTKHFTARPVMGGLLARMVVKSINTHNMTKFKSLMDLHDVFKV